MKKKTVAMITGALLVAMAMTVTGCGNSGNSGTAVIDGTADDGAKIVSDITEDLADDGELNSVSTDDADADEAADEGQDVMEYLDGMYRFTYKSADFTSFEGDDHSCTVSYTNEETEVAGSNVISISVVRGTTYDAALKDATKGMTLADSDPVECYFGADGITAYTVSTGALSAEGSDLTTSDTFYAIPDGDDVIILDVFRTIGPDEETEIKIDDSMATVLDTFSLMEEAE